MPPYPGHHPSSKEMQLWQQQLMYKQLQEIQRQQQLQQLDHGTRQQNAYQLPSLQNGMLINDSSSYMLPNDIMGVESKTPSSSQMFTANNSNWAQGRGSPGVHGSVGLMLTNDHGQAMRPVGFIPQQQLDQSLYGTPVSSSRGLFNQYPHFQGMPNNFTDVMAKAVRDQLEQASVRSVSSNSFQKDQRVPEQACLKDGVSVTSAQGFQGKNLFVNAPVQNLSGGTTAGNFQQVNHSNSIERQVFHGGQEQASWSSNLEEKTATEVGPSRGMTSLDPTEEKILFGTDDDSNWSASFGRINNMGSGGYLHGDPFEGNDQFGAFPSLQSGSWSALMQEAVQASSSDKGFQEEWSGISSQKMEPSIGNSCAMHNDNAKHQVTWDKNSNNFRSPSSVSLRPPPLFNDVNSGPLLPSAPSFLHSMGTSYVENNGVQTDASHESFQQSSKDGQNMHFDQSHKKTGILDSGVQTQIQSNDVPHGIWSKHMYEQSISADSANNYRQPDSNPNVWNKSLTTHGDSTLEGFDNNRTLYAQNGGNSSSGMEPAKSDIGSSHIRSVAFSTSNFAAVVNSNNLNANQERNQHALNRYQFDPGKHVAFDSFVTSRCENVQEYQHRPSKGQQVQDSSANSTERSPSMSDSQTSSGMSGWKTVGSRTFQSHQIENLGMNGEPADSPKDMAYSQNLPKLVNQQSKSQEQGYIEDSQFAGHGASNTGQGHATDMQRNINSPEESQHRSRMPGQTSQNMLELLHKVDNSRDNSAVACFGNSDFNSVNDTHEAGPPHGSASYPHHHQSSVFQGFGLRKEMSQLIAHGNSSAVTASNLSYMGRQLLLQKQQQLLQQQHISSLTGSELVNPSVNFTSESQADVEEHIKQASLLRQAQISHGVDLSSQSSQASFTTMAGRILPFRLDSSADAHGSGSQVNSPGTGHTQPANAGFYHLKSSAQQLPFVETGPAVQASARSGVSQQIGFSTMLHNVWTNASVQQIISGVQPQKLISNVPQSIMPTSSGDKNSGAIPMEDDQGNKGGSVPSGLGTCSRNSQQFTEADKKPVEKNSLQGTDSERVDSIPKTGSALEEQEQVPKHHSDRNSAVSISSLGHFPHYDANREKQWPNFAAFSDVGLYGRSVLPSNIQQPNYSSLPQIQAMKGTDSDAGRRDGKRLKGELGSDASHTEWQAGPLADELGASSHSAFPSDVKMLNFSSRENEEKTAEKTAQLVDREGSSQNIYLSGQPDLQSQTQPHTSTSQFIGRNEHPLLNSQMAHSWLEQYRKYKNSQILAMYADQKSAKAASQQYFPSDVSARIDSNALAERRNETSQFGSVSQSMSVSSRVANESSLLFPLGVTGHDMVIRSKKRKSATSELLPWHQVVSLGVQRLQSTSMAEHDWAQAANRLTEKVEDAAEMVEDGSLIPRARRRLILTTQLMQQLLPSIPAPILAAEVTSAHESVTYFLAKSALGDACSLISCSGSDSGEYLDNEDRTSGKRKTSEKASEVFFSKVVEDFIGRSRKLETVFSRLDKRTSLLDVRLEWQELERFSLVNRLGKLHGRSQADGAESSSSSQNTPRKTFPQRNVTAFSLPGNVPDGVLCLSL